MDPKKQLEEIYRIIEQLGQDDNLKKNASQDGVYSDEPILRTAAQIPRPAAKAAVPAKIRDMRDLAFADHMFWQPKERIFIEQARFMESYEDDLEYTGQLELSFPTYSDLTIEQLRGYFTWRAAVRKGGFPDAPKAFIYIYCFELINGIGAESPEDSCAKLARIRDRYGEDRFLKRDTERWIKDLAIYHRLAPELASLPSVGAEPAVYVLTHPGGYDDGELFGAVKELSDYLIETSTYYKEYPAEVAEVTCGLFRALAEYFGGDGSEQLMKKLYTTHARSHHYHRLFLGAVFVDMMRDRSYVYELNICEHYECENGVYSCDMVYVPPHRNHVIGMLLRAVDYMMRKRYGFRYKLGSCRVSSEDEKLINAAMDRLDEHKKQNSIKKVEIDVSKLGNIRHSADIIREKLIVDDEEDGTPADPVPEPGQPAPEDSVLPLNDGELGYLRCLLYGGDANAAAKSAGSMPSLLADAINDKLFDMFGDTVIELSGGEPSVIEDYTDELKGLITT
ncbi:MAG: TerB N-terminal domain-containing protein [Ruminiclostridium sp.]|nr:TerB N-terminal domain-containing protein [Ruminiclostridium sp.]